MNITQCHKWSSFLWNFHRHMIGLLCTRSIPTEKQPWVYNVEKEPNRSLYIVTQGKCNKIQNRFIIRQIHTTEIDTTVCYRFISAQIIPIESVISYFCAVGFLFQVFPLLHLVSDWMNCGLLQDVITSSPVKTCTDFTQVTPSQATCRVSPWTDLLFRIGFDCELLECCRN